MRVDAVDADLWIHDCDLRFPFGSSVTDASSEMYYGPDHAESESGTRYVLSRAALTRRGFSCLGRYSCRGV